MKDVNCVTKPFQNIEPTRQQRIIKAAMQEFAEKGYEQASTNAIVEKANIGKGMLFYYFDNKKGLFLYLIEYALQAVKRDYISLIDLTITDFIERMRHIAQLKITYHRANPEVSLFLSSAYINPPFDLPEHLSTQIKELIEMGEKMMYDNIDTSLLRDDVDPNKAFQLIRYAIEGYQNNLLAHFTEQPHLIAADLEPYWDEFYEYIAILKTCFYKQ